jgi:Na+/H+ antiporter NhaD/arsenite permease-like protein
MFAIALLLLVFYLVDRRQWRIISNETALLRADTERERWRIFGIRNLLFMLLLLVALTMFASPGRELVMIAAAILSYLTSPRHVHTANGFSFLPLKEVAALFFGIFATMIPVLEYVELHARDLHVKTEAQFFWATGLLSAFLDNAPAYLTFLAGAVGLRNLEMNNPAQFTGFVASHDQYLIAISLGATFFGALTYVGNGPNLLVKAIAQNLNVPTPTFFGFTIRYALPVLLPILALLSIWLW